jgi:protein phosphatase
LVADGMGGHLAGEVASHWVVETLKRELAGQFLPPDPRQTLHLSGEQMDEMKNAATNGLRPIDVPMIHELRQAVIRANRAVHQYTLNRPQEALGAGSTLTMAFVKGKRAYVVNVGDSRTYLLRQGQLVQLTKDHSRVAELVAAGQLTPQEAWNHPQAGRITRCLGYIEQVDVDIKPFSLKSGDYLLLCSDGLWEMIRDPEVIVRIVETAPNLQVATRRLVEAANHVGGKDNIAVALLRLAEYPDIAF